MNTVNREEIHKMLKGVLWDYNIDPYNFYGVLKIVKELNLPFYLTGGTALNRFYYN